MRILSHGMDLPDIEPNVLGISLRTEEGGILVPFEGR